MLRVAGFSQVRKLSQKKLIKLRKFYLIYDRKIIEIYILKENQIKLKYNIAGRKISGFCDLKDLNEEGKTITRK